MDFVEAHFQQEIRKFRRLLRAQSQHLTVAGVHDLRVSTRRLRAQLRLIEKNSSHAIPIPLLKSLKKLTSALGERRQWDVTLKEAHKFQLAEDPLRKEQTRAGQRLQKVLRSRDVQALPVILKGFEVPLKNEEITISKKFFNDMRSQLKTWLKQKKFSTRDLHELRISTKKIRYAFECMDLPVEDLKDLQDHLGKSHDLTVLRDYFNNPKKVRKADRKERRRATQRIRPALSTSLEVLNLLR